MKSNHIIFPVILLIGVFGFSCYNPWKGGEGSITVSVGSGGRAVLADGTNTNSLTHTITITDSSGVIQTATLEPGKTAVSFSALALGQCAIVVEGLLDGEVKARGSSSVNIKAGRNDTAAIVMELIGAVGIEYTITFNSNGGSDVVAQKVADGEKANRPDNPTRIFVTVAGLYEGMPEDLSYTFDGWYNEDGNLYTFTEEVTGDITLTAQWADPEESTLIDEVDANDVAAAVGYINDKPNAYTLLIDSGEAINAGAQTLSTADVSLTIMGIGGECTIQATAVPLFTVRDGASLTLENNITLKGISNGSGSLVKIDEGGALTMETGSKITGNTTSANGGGVYVSGGTFTMYNGEIFGNVSTGSGGGVYVNSGEFIMRGGEISGNTTGDEYGGFGGGVFVDRNGTFKIVTGKIYGSEEIEGSANTFLSPKYGGGAALDNQLGTAQYGWFGGDFVSNGDLHTTNSTINVEAGVPHIGNTPANNYTFTITNNAEWQSARSIIATYSGSEIKYTINVTGGFLFTGRTDYTFGHMYPGATGINVTIQGTGETLSLFGTGRILRIGDGQTVILKNLILQGNDENDAELVTVSGGTLTMENCIITGNTAKHSSTGYGGGVVVSSGIITMYGGEISGNTVTSGERSVYGGGVSVTNEGTFIMNEGAISGNKAIPGIGEGGPTSGNGGGVYVASGGTFRVTDGTIYGSDEDEKSNTAPQGAALYKEDGATAQYGKEGGTWTDLTTTNETLEVKDGARLP
jgi:uncharacterized repeat protein (TIGR02543 family)